MTLTFKAHQQSNLVFSRRGSRISRRLRSAAPELRRVRAFCPGHSLADAMVAPGGEDVNPNFDNIACAAADGNHLRELAPGIFIKTFEPSQFVLSGAPALAAAFDDDEEEDEEGGDDYEDDELEDDDEEGLEDEEAFEDDDLDEDDEDLDDEDLEDEEDEEDEDDEDE